MNAIPTQTGVIFHTGAASADNPPFGQMTTIDGPPPGGDWMDAPKVVAHAFGRQGVYLLSKIWYTGTIDGLPYGYGYVDVLPVPGGSTDITYDQAKKQTYRWKSKKFVMAGRTTWAAAKVVHSKGCVRLRLYIDGCCKYETVVKGCGPFRLADQLVGKTLEIELVGTAQVTEVHVASTIEELASE
jgi:hypothetical protein